MPPARAETEYAKLRADNKALREEMHAGFARIDRFFVGIVLLLLGLYFGSFLWF